MFGPVASDPTVSRLIDTLTAGGHRALNAIRSAPSSASARMEVGPADRAGCDRVCDRGPGRRPGDLALRQGRHGCDLKDLGHHPLMGFVDHGKGGSGEPMAALLRPGNAGSNTAADHITATPLALTQLPKSYRRGRRTLIRTDSRAAPRVRGLARETRPVAVVLGRHDHHRRNPPGRTQGAARGMDAGRRARWRDPRRGLGRRTHRRHAGRAGRGACDDRSKGTATPQCPVEDHDANGIRITCSPPTPPAGPAGGSPGAGNGTRRAGSCTSQCSGPVSADVPAPSFELWEPVLAAGIGGRYRPAVFLLGVAARRAARWVSC